MREHYRIILLPMSGWLSTSGQSTQLSKYVPYMAYITSGDMTFIFQYTVIHMAHSECPHVFQQVQYGEAAHLRSGVFRSGPLSVVSTIPIKLMRSG